MCTDLRLVRLADRHVSARTLDFAMEVESTVRVVPRGQTWQSTASTGAAHDLAWSNSLGFVGITAFGFDDYSIDGMNEAGLSVGTLWLPETRLPSAPDAANALPAIDFINLAGWLLGTCSTVAEVRTALSGVQVWNAPVRLLWPKGRPEPASLAPLMDWAFTEHLAIHDASGGDLVVEFLDGAVRISDNPVGVLTNSPTFDWHLTNLRNYLGLTNAEEKPVNLMGMEVSPTGNGTGLRGIPGDVTPPSRFVRATVLSEVVAEVSSTRDAVNQAFHCLDLVSVPRHLASSGDYTQWYVVRDHDARVLYLRSYDGWTTDVHDLGTLDVAGSGAPSSLGLPAAPQVALS